jgi:hypothetical protein
MQAHSEARSQSINEVANQINTYLREAVDRPELRRENAQKVNLLIQMVPLDMQAEVRQRVHVTRDPSIYSRLLRQREERELMDNYAHEVERMNNGTAN